MLEAKYALGKSVVFVAAGTAALLAEISLYLWAPVHYPVLGFVGVLGVLVGLRGLDPRVKIRIGPEGFWYSAWGAQTFQWGEFSRISEFELDGFKFLELHPVFPAQLRTQMPLISRINSAVNERMGKPAFYVNPTQFDVSAEELLAALRQNVPAV